MKLLIIAACAALASTARAQWAPQASGTNAEFRGLAAVSQTVVWASGTHGRFVRTTDGGATWVLDSVPGAGSLDLRAIVARDAMHAWAVSAGPAEQGQANIFRTQDGVRWTRVFETSQPGVFLDALAFWDDRHGIALSDPVEGRLFILVTDDGGTTWTPINRGLKSQYIPDPDAEVGHCVHRIAMHPSRPDTLFMQKHWDVMRTDDAGAQWTEVSGNLPTDFGFPIDVHAHEPETIYVVPITSDSHHFPPEGKLRVYRSRTGGHEWEPLTNGLPQRDCYVNVLRDAMAVDRLDSCGIYFGTTGGQVYASADSGDTWAPIVRDLPAVLSVEVQTLP